MPEKKFKVKLLGGVHTSILNPHSDEERNVVRHMNGETFWEREDVVNAFPDKFQILERSTGAPAHIKTAVSDAVDMNMSKDDLKLVASDLGLSTEGTKKDLVDRIKEVS